MEQQKDAALFDMNMDGVMQNHILSVSKWTKFISVTAFIFFGLIIIGLVAASSAVIDRFSALYSFNSQNVSIIIAVIIAAMAVAVVWVYFLFRASTMLKKGLQTRAPNDIAEGFKALRIFFTISFIFSILSILSTVQSFL